MNKAAMIFMAIVGIALTSHGAMTREDVEKFVTEKQITCYHAGDFEGCERWLLENGATSNMLVDIYTKIAWETINHPQRSYESQVFYRVILGIGDLADDDHLVRLEELAAVANEWYDIQDIVAMYHRRRGGTHAFVDYCARVLLTQGSTPQLRYFLWKSMYADYMDPKTSVGVRTRIAALAEFTLRARQFPACASYADKVLADHDIIYRFSAKRHRIAADALSIGGACQMGSGVYGHFESITRGRYLR